MFEWQVSVRKERSAGWYAIAGIVVASLVVWGFFEGIYALSVVAVIFAGVFLLVENNAPDSVVVTVDENGVGVGSEFYDYGKIENFGILFDDGKAVLLRLKVNKKGVKTADIDLPDGANPAELRAFLSGYCEESKESELSTSERLLRMLGF